jgi:hypothetical protein
MSASSDFIREVGLLYKNAHPPTLRVPGFVAAVDRDGLYPRGDCLRPSRLAGGWSSFSVLRYADLGADGQKHNR